MIVLALILLLLAAAAVVVVIAVGRTTNVDFSFFAGDFTTSPLWIFIGGAVTLLLALAGLALIRRGTQRKVAQRREIKRLRKVEETSVAPTHDNAHAAGTLGGAHHGRDHDLDRGDVDRGDVDRGDVVHRGDLDRSDLEHRGGSTDETLIREPRRSPDETRGV